MRISAEKAGSGSAAPARAPRSDARSEARPERTERAPRIADAVPGSRMNQVVDRAFSAPAEFDRDDRAAKPKKDKAGKAKVSVPMQTYRIEVGKADTVTPANIVGAIANEAGMEAKYIGRIDIFDHHSTLDLPVGMPPELLSQLKGVWVAGKQIKISPVGEPTSGGIAHDFPAGQKKSGGDRRVLEKAAGKPSSKPAGKLSNGRPSKFDKDSGTTRRKSSK